MKHKRTRSATMKDEIFAFLSEKKNNTPLRQWIVKGQKDECVVIRCIAVDHIPNDSMLPFLDNSDSPSIVEQ